MEPGGVELRSPRAMIRRTSATASPDRLSCSILSSTLRFAAYALSLCEILVLTAQPLQAQVVVQKAPKKKATVDAAAALLLQQMADTYAHMPELHQRSLYTAVMHTKPGATPVSAEPANGKSAGPDATVKTADKLDPPSLDSNGQSAEVPIKDVYRTVEMQYVQPNLLRITDSLRGETDLMQIPTWDSDGKNFYSFVPYSHGQHVVYTQEKAPRNIREFAKLQNIDSGTLELVMLMGINPFHNLNSEEASVHILDPVTVRGVPTDVVSILSSTPRERIQVKLYIGHEDHMLHRFTTDTTPTGPEGAVRIGDSLDEQEDIQNGGATSARGSDPNNPLEENEIGGGSRQSMTAIHTVYDNVVIPVTHVEAETFEFKPPENAAIFRPAGSKVVIDPNSKRLMDIIHKSKQAHGKPIHDVKPVHDIAP